jgi:UDP-N-acetylglucosamine 2-epimerase (hydrolysing)
MLEKSYKIVFITGTRADFGKLKSLIKKLQDVPKFEIHIFVTGMHMLTKYGYTCDEVEKSGLPNIYKYVNQNSSDSMDHILAKTISGLSDYVREILPDLLIIHGDRVEALAGASVGALNNILTAHIEGGEVSGTIDELIRHAVTKLSHIHFVSNNNARNRIIQLGENAENIHVIGSPDIDLMNQKSLVPIDNVKSRYEFNFDEYGIIMFHSVTSELDDISRQIKVIVDEVINSNLNYIVIYPNNDPGTDLIIEEYERLLDISRFKIYPSMRFEYFLSLLNGAKFIIGNSSAGVREAPHFGVPAINLGSRQANRVNSTSIINEQIEYGKINQAILKASNLKLQPESLFGSGNSDEKFFEILNSSTFWETKMQKYFIDQNKYN